MTLCGGCSVWARMAKRWLFPSRICVQASLESLMINHPSFPVLTSMCSGPQVCSAPAHCRSRSPSCHQATLRSLPRKPPPCLGLAVHLRGNLLLSWTRLSGGETESNSGSYFHEVKGFSLCSHAKHKLFKTAPHLSNIQKS